eukprot:scaffold661280_cov62-Prasinocladus_malaysianus.AAC.1
MVRVSDHTGSSVITETVRGYSIRSGTLFSFTCSQLPRRVTTTGCPEFTLDVSRVLTHLKSSRKYLALPTVRGTSSRQKPVAEG